MNDNASRLSKSAPRSTVLRENEPGLLPPCRAGFWPCSAAISSSDTIRHLSKKYRQSSRFTSLPGRRMSSRPGSALSRVSSMLTCLVSSSPCPNETRDRCLSSSTSIFRFRSRDPENAVGHELPLRLGGCAGVGQNAGLRPSEILLVSVSAGFENPLRLNQ